MPKKGGPLTGRRLVSLEEAASKIRAACDARYNDDFIIIARCDALSVTGMDDVKRRCTAYADAGADVIFVESPSSLEELRAIPGYFDIPVLVNVASSGKTPILSIADYENLGYKIAILPNYTTLAAIKAIKGVLETIKETGDVRLVLERCASFEDFLAIAGLEAIQVLEQRYGSDEGDSR